MVKNLSANAGDTGDTGLVPGLGTSHSSILAWKIPWTEEPGGVPVHRGHKRVKHN